MQVKLPPRGGPASRRASTTDSRSPGVCPPRRASVTEVSGREGGALPHPVERAPATIVTICSVISFLPDTPTIDVVIDRGLVTTL